MRSMWCLLLVHYLSNCFAFEVSANSESLLALIDKLIAQTDTTPEKEETKYRKDDNNARVKLANDSNVIYLKLVPSETQNLTLQPNTTIVDENGVDFKSKDPDLKNSFIERNAAKFLNATSDKEVLNKILHEIKTKLDTNKSEKETEDKLKTSDNIKSNEKYEPAANNLRSGFVDLLENDNTPDIMLSKKTFALKDDDDIEKILPDVLTSVKKQLDENDTTELLKKVLDTKKTKDENLSPIEQIPSRRRYSPKEETATNPSVRSNLLRNPSLLGSFNIPTKKVQNPINLCSNCKHQGLLNLPLNNNLSKNARLQEVMRRSLIGNFVNTIRPNVMHKHFNGMFK